MIDSSNTAPMTQNPCYVQPFSEVFNEDCIQVMKRYPDKFFDLSVVDPPYGNNLSGGRSAKNGWNNKIDWNKCNKGWNLEIPTPEYFAELQRVSKNQIVWGGNYFANMLPNSECWLIWDKGQRDFSLADGEMAWASFDKAMRIHTLHRAVANQENKMHPTQKPVKLYDWIFSKFASKGDLILDTHLGSGSIAIACHKMKRKLIGYEIDAEYYQNACKRFEEQTRQTALW